MQPKLKQDEEIKEGWRDSSSTLFEGNILGKTLYLFNSPFK